MPHVVFTPRGDAGLRRCRRFLAEKSPFAATRAAKEIARCILLLQTTPDIGRPVKRGRRELLIPFGASGYVALYLHDPAADAVYILRVPASKRSRVLIDGSDFRPIGI